MISYTEAKRLILEMSHKPAEARVNIEDAVGHRLSEDLYARVSLPSFNNSAMDGYAFSRVDLETCRTLKIIGTVFADISASKNLPEYQTNSCVRVMTGALVPDWADTVVPLEQTVLADSSEVTFVGTKIEHGANIRRSGEDLQQGHLVMKTGTILSPERVMVAAALGYRQVKVEIKPKLVLISTGDELLEPGQSLVLGGVYNSTKYFLKSATSALGLFADVVETVPDSPDVLSALINRICHDEQPTVILSTGAVSMGEADFIPSIASKLGFEPRFHKVAIRPGKPAFFATRNNIAWLGLPGNPISTAVGWHIFARPLLAKWFNCPDTTKKRLILKNEVKKPEELRCFFRAEVNHDRAWVAKNQGSGNFSASINCGAYVELPEGLSRFAADTPIDAIIL